MDTSCAAAAYATARRGIAAATAHRGITAGWNWWEGGVILTG